MRDPAILFVKPKAIKASDKKAMEAAGVIVVEVADPQSVKLTRPHAELSGSELLRMACSVIANNSSTGTREAFATEICNAIAARDPQ